LLCLPHLLCSRSYAAAAAGAVTSGHAGVSELAASSASQGAASKELQFAIQYT